MTAPDGHAPVIPDPSLGASPGVARRGGREITIGVGLGVLAGILSGLFGVGGGIVLVPLLVLVLAMGQHQAHATSLAAIILTAAAGAARYAWGGEVAYDAAIAISLGAVAGAYAGAAMMRRLSPEGLRLAFAVLMTVVAVQMLLGLTPAGGARSALTGVAAIVGYVLLGLIVGTLSALMGVGGGIIMVPAMVLLFGLSQHTAEGTSLLIIIPTAIAGAVRHAKSGYTDWRLGITVGLGGIIGALGGAQVALTLASSTLQRLFAAFLLVMSVRMLWSRRKRPQLTEA